jgi:hypothetical protein
MRFWVGAAAASSGKIKETHDEYELTRQGR